MFKINGVCYITKEELAKRWHCTKRSIELWRKEKKIPQPVKFDKPPSPVEAGSHRVAWKLADIEAHEARIKKSAASLDFN